MSASALAIVTAVACVAVLICFGLAYKHSSSEGKIIAVLIAGASLLQVFVAAFYLSGKGRLPLTLISGEVALMAGIFEVVVSLVASVLLVLIARDGAQRG